jgi:hypothetical protein
MIQSVSQVMSQRRLTKLRVDNDGKGNSSKEELRAYLRYVVTKDFHRVGFHCDEAVINKFDKDLILDQESKRIEEENPNNDINHSKFDGVLHLLSKMPHSVLRFYHS